MYNVLNQKLSCKTIKKYEKTSYDLHEYEIQSLKIYLGVPNF